MNIETRVAATREDIEAALEIRRVVFIEEQGVAHDIERDGLDGEATHVIAEADGRVVAAGRFVTQADEHGATARVGRMAVLGEFRRHGIATAVLEALETEARRQGLGGIELHSQSYVQRFYDRCGYTVAGEPFVEAGIDHVTMVKHF